VVLRVLHSLLQVSVNIVPVRFLLFSISTGVLAAMVVRELPGRCPRPGPSGSGRRR
jgi:hypothetical protein